MYEKCLEITARDATVTPSVYDRLCCQLERASLGGVMEPFDNRDGRDHDHPVHVRLLGGFDVSHGREQVRLPADGQKLVAFLALQGGAAQRAFVAGSLWLDVTQERAFGNLRSALWRVRSQSPSLIEADTHTLRLGSGMRVDVDVAASVANHIFSRSGAESHIGDYDLELFTRELLPGWYDEFVLIARESLHQQSLHVLEAIAYGLLRCGRHGAAMQAAMGSIRIDRLRESAHRVVIEIHIAEGNYSEAHRHYVGYAELLARELALAPSPNMNQLIATIPSTNSNSTEPVRSTSPSVAVDATRTHSTRRADSASAGRLVRPS